MMGNMLVHTMGCSVSEANRSTMKSWELKGVLRVKELLKLFMAVLSWCLIAVWTSSSHGFHNEPTFCSWTPVCFFKTTFNFGFIFKKSKREAFSKELETEI